MKYLILLLIPLVFGCSGPGKGLKTAPTGFRKFPIDEGYPPGTIVEIKNQKIVDVIYDNDGLEEFIKDSSEYFELSETFNLPNIDTLDRTGDISGRLRSDSSSLEVSNVRKASLRVEDGYTQTIKGGTSKLYQFIRQIPKSRIKEFKQPIYGGGLFEAPKKVYIITAVKTFKNAKLDVFWESKLDASAQMEIAKKLKLDGNVKWENGSKMVVSYDKPTYVEYKAIRFK